MDFYQIKERSAKNGVLEIYPDFKVCRSKDLMVRGKSFYAIWDKEKNLWSTDEYDVQRLIDEELDIYKEKIAKRTDCSILVKYMSDFSSNSWINFRNYVSHISDNDHQLDENLTFQNTKVNKQDYVSKRLGYSLEEGDYSAYDEIIGTLYSESERAKLEWSIGAVIAGDAKSIQKFIVLYGEAGAGKSTILNIIQWLFEGYYTTFEAKAITSSSNAFSTEVFKSNPLVAIQHDGDLSRIEDNTKLNSIVSHEEMTMNEKYKPSYTARVNCFLFMATNRPVKITDAKSGIIRRLIDVRPSGNKIPPKRYQALMTKIPTELGAIAKHCLDVYRSMGKNYYQAYRPLEMIFQTDVFFNFIEANYYVFKEQNGTTLSQAYDIYKKYCEEALVDFKLPRHKFREELKNYFADFFPVTRLNGKQVRSYYSGFLKDKFKIKPPDPIMTEHPTSLVLDCSESIFDKECCDCSAQYANDDGIPLKPWNDICSTLSDIDTSKVHFVRVPLNHIVIDFDLKDSDGNKSLEMNLSAASKWPPTYAEISKGGNGIHLHYIYDGDPNRLSRIYSEDIEIKVFTGKSSLRRKLTKCNDISIAHIKDGLPLKGESRKMINFQVVRSEKVLRERIIKNLNKEYHPATKPSIDFINEILNQAYESGLHYDVTDLRPKVLAFANNSTNNSSYCVKLVSKMKFKSEEGSDFVDDYTENDIVFYDVEVFPNLFLINWKFAGDDKQCIRMINPTATEVQELFKFKLVGFNCRRYDNHILYGRYIGYNNEQLYKLSQKIISGNNNAMFREAYNISYTDVYDFCSKKQSLKKWEIELGIHHQELGLPWDEPVPEDRWEEVAEYCDNDVVATEAVFNHNNGDWIARQILADLSGMSVNDKTNTHTTKIIFGKDKEPQKVFNYWDLSKEVESISDDTRERLEKNTVLPMIFEPDDLPFKSSSILPYFPGYKFEYGKSSYRGEETGEGGYVYAEPGIAGNVALLDVASMHPTSIECMDVFGPYTERFSMLKQARIAVKHGDYETAGKMFDGKLSKFLKNKEVADQLAYALKIAINSVYGLTSAKFSNPFRDPRNDDNIVAKRGALFMIDLKNAVQEKGYSVMHIKTDSIKIPDATPEIIEFVMEFGKRYGYIFEHEATYEKMCLVNDAVYVAKYKWADNPKKNGKWTHTGAQFQHPYVFKTLFSKEPISFEDMCETKAVTSALYLDMNENLPDVSRYEDERDLIIQRLKNGSVYKTPDDIHKANERLEELEPLIAQGHDYQFVGKVGSFCPIEPGKGGGILVREKDGKYYAATGTTGYRWLESESVKEFHKESDIDSLYFKKLLDDAIEAIHEYGDFKWFASEESYTGPNDSRIWPK